MLLARMMLLSLGLFLSACSNVEVRTDHDSAVDFSRYSTYAWKKRPTTSFSLMNQRIVAAVEEQLSAKGWRKAPETEAQTMLAATVTTRDGQRVDTVHNNWGGPGMPGWGWGGPMMMTSHVVSYTVGSLIVDIYDSRTHDAIWRGTASGLLSDNPKRVRQSIDKGVGGMFNKFPPGVAGNPR